MERKWPLRDTDGTLAANSDSKVPSQKAVKTYVSSQTGTGLVTVNGIVKGNGAGTFAAATAGTDYQPPPFTTNTASSATPTPAVGTAGAEIRYNLTALAEAATFGAPTGTPVNGQVLVIRIKDNATARALAYNAIYRAGDYALPTTTVISKTMKLYFEYNTADAKWDFTGFAPGF